MKKISLLMLNSFYQVLNHEINELVKLVAPIIPVAPILGVIIAFFTLISNYKNQNKDRLILGIGVKRARDGWLSVNFPKEEFILFEVYNKGVSSTIINEIGIT